MIDLHPKYIGPFPGVVQIVAPFESKSHELLSGGPNLDGAAAGDLINHGGPTIVGGQVFNVYLGLSVNTILDAFARDACASFYLSPDGVDSSPSKFLGSISVPQYPFNASVDDGTIQAWVDQQVQSGVFPAQSGTTIYSLMFPPGPSVSMSGASSCNDFCGYHSMTSGGNYYQVICDNSCAGCHGGNTAQEALEMIWVHEYVEWRSDPTGRAWFDSQGAENGDKCAWRPTAWGPYTVQPQWCNVKGGCFVPPYVAVPPPPPVPQPTTALMAMGVQPTGGSLGVKLSTFTIQMLKSDGTLNANDNSSVVSVSIQPGGYNPRFVKAVAGVATFTGDTFQTHTGNFYYMATCPGLPAIISGSFSITAGPPPPPPPPPTRTYEEGYADARAKALAAIQSL